MGMSKETTLRVLNGKVSQLESTVDGLSDKIHGGNPYIKEQLEMYRKYYRELIELEMFLEKERE